MKADTNVAVKAGLIGVAIGIVVAVLERTTLLGCLLGGAGTIVALVTGALYVHLIDRSVDTTEGAMGGGIAGAVAGAAKGLASGLMSLIWGTAGAGSDILGGELCGGFLRGATTFFGVILLMLFWIVVGALLGAIGGAVYSAIKK